MLTLFLEPRPQFVPGGGGSVTRVTPVKSTPPERLNLRRPDGPSTESIAKIQEQIDKLTAYWLSTGTEESTAEQIQELRTSCMNCWSERSLALTIGRIATGAGVGGDFRRSAGE